MLEQDYYDRRAKLVGEFFNLKRLRLYRSAAARVRQIAKLDYDYDGRPIEKTKAIFDYDSLMKK